MRQDLVPESLKMLCVEIASKCYRPFLMSTWYRPTNAEIDLFNNFELFLLSVIWKKYRLFAVWEVCTEEYFPEVLERPETEGRGTLLRSRENIFQYTDRPEW